MLTFHVAVAVGQQCLFIYIAKSVHLDIAVWLAAGHF